MEVVEMPYTIESVEKFIAGSDEIARKNSIINRIFFFIDLTLGDIRCKDGEVIISIVLPKNIRFTMEKDDFNNVRFKLDEDAYLYTKNYKWRSFYSDVVKCLYDGLPAILNAIQDSDKIPKKLKNTLRKNFNFVIKQAPEK